MSTFQTLDYCVSRRKSFPQYISFSQKAKEELKIKMEAPGAQAREEDCPSRRPDWPKTIIPWWTPSNSKEKPPYSYATLIAHAILSSQEGRLTLNDIYVWISDHYTTYSIGAGGWQNSIRHNLSLNKKWFQKIERRRTQANSGKGSYWTLLPGAEKVFVENLTQEGSHQSKRYHGVNVTKDLGSRKRRSCHQKADRPTVTPILDSRTRCQNESSSADPSALYSTFRLDNTLLEARKRKRSIDSLETDSDYDSGVDVTEPLRKQCRTVRAYSAQHDPSFFSSSLPYFDQETGIDYLSNTSPLTFTHPSDSCWDLSYKNHLLPVNNLGDNLYPPFFQCEFVSMQQVLFSDMN